MTDQKKNHHRPVDTTRVRGHIPRRRVDQKNRPEINIVAVPAAAAVAVRRRNHRNLVTKTAVLNHHRRPRSIRPIRRRRIGVAAINLAVVDRKTSIRQAAAVSHGIAIDQRIRIHRQNRNIRAAAAAVVDRKTITDQIASPLHRRHHHRKSHRKNTMTTALRRMLPTSWPMYLSMRMRTTLRLSAA